MTSNDPQTREVADQNAAERSNVPIELSNMSSTQQGSGAIAKISTISNTENTMENIENAPYQSREKPNESATPLPGTSATVDSSSRTPDVPPVPPEPLVSPPPLIREATGPAIGPATDKPASNSREPDVEGPVLYITLLLTTGARHPFRLDRRYLKKRNVEVEGDNPVNMSLYKLKELILRDWREEWEAKPSSPDSIRLISMGKLLTDKSKLSDFGFKDGASPTIVHMTIKPQELLDEEEANKNVRDREGSVRTPRCRCLVM